MATDVIMPQMGESIFEGTITKWLKKAGDSVEKDEPLFEISTDKVDAEIPSPVAGVLTEIKVPEGATVEVNTVVAVIGGASASGPAATATTPVPAPEAKLAAQQVPPKLQSAAPQMATPVAGAIEIVMPQLGESIFEGTITKWLKKTGDRVEKDEPLFEISTDKVDAEIPSPVAGVLTEIKIPEGATVEVNTVVAVIGGTGATTASALEAQPATLQVSLSAQMTTPQGSGQRIFSSPLVRHIAKENKIDLGQIAGSGSHGRITKEDILRHLSQHGPGSAPPESPAAHLQSAAPQSFSPQMSGEVVPLTKMRTIIAQRMLESKRISPHVHSVYKVDMTRIARLRERERVGFEQRHGIKLTYMPFIAAAAVDALRRFPILNASLIDSATHYHDHINLGIAVALEWGLIVPVVKESEARNFLSLAGAIHDLASRARTKKLMPDEVQGSTFTLTNSGVFGGEFGTPIINQPESAILAIGGLRKEPVVLTDAAGNDAIAVRSVQYFCLGFDHRLIDGADSGKFMLEFKKTLENWDRKIG